MVQNEEPEAAWVPIAAPSLVPPSRHDPPMARCRKTRTPDIDIFDPRHLFPQAAFCKIGTPVSGPGFLAGKVLRNEGHITVGSRWSCDAAP